MIYKVTRFFTNPIDETKEKSKVGAGMVAAGVGLGVGGSMLSDNGFNQFVKSSEGQQFKSVTENLVKNKSNMTAQQISNAKGEMKTITDNAFFGKGSKEATSGMRKLVGGTAMKRVGIGLGVLGAGKMLYDSFKNKD